MDRFYNALRQLRFWSQPAICVAVAMIAAIWVSINFHLAVEHDSSRRTAIQDTGNLARVFEEHIARTIMEADRAILLLRTSYQLTGNFDLASSLASPSLRNDLLTQIRVFDPDGMIIAGSRERSLSRVGFSDREYFRVHVDSKADELFISKPVFGRTSGKWVLQLSRGVHAAGGSFQGVIGASLDPGYLTKFYQSIDVGQHGAIILAGLDGVVRASAGFNSDVVGGSLLGSQLFRRISQADTGSFLTAGSQDGIKRIVSYRVVNGYPLVVYVGESEDEVLANYWRDRRLYFAVGTGLTALIAISAAFAALYRSKLDAVQRELEATLENMSQGIMKVDADHNVAFINRRAIELLELPDHFLKRHVALADVLKFQWTRGEFGINGEALDPRVREKIQSGDLHHIGVYQRTRPNGVVLEISTLASPDGGVIRTYTDVTERRQNEIRIAHLLRHDDLTTLANRTLFNERIEQALARMQRQHEGFALFCLDLDGFKAVNDTRGHPAGDMLLRAVADRLSACVRETDTVARLGGDEFAILQSMTGREGDAEILARRILEAVGTPYDLDGDRAVIGISIGIAVAPHDGTNIEELLKAADVALYRAKSEGPNAYRFFGHAMDANAMPMKLLAAIH
jgi:diguanylate cyclase (GGDEF)-like protein